MKRLSFIFLAAAMLLGATGSFAQDRKQAKRVKLFSNEEFFSKSDYIIQARAIRLDLHTYDIGGNYDPNDLYTSGLLIVTYVYKNNNSMSISQGDTLNYISKGGSILQPMSEEQPWATMLVMYPSQMDYDLGYKGFVSIEEDYESVIYFMKISDLPENPDVSRRNKYPKVAMLQDVKGASISIPHNAYGLNGLQFNNRYELYKYMEQFEGVTVPLSRPEQMKWYLRRHEGVFEQYLKERNVKWVDGNDPQMRDSLMRFMEMKRQIAQKNREKREREQSKTSRRADNILTVSIQNQRVNYNHNSHKYYFHFDVYVNANNSSTYLDNVIMRLNYNTAAFGTNIEANNKVTVVRSAGFNTPTYDRSDSAVYDATSNSLNFGINVGAVANPARVQLTVNPVKLLEVDIELLNGLTGTAAGLIFTDVDFTLGLSLFTPASNSSYSSVEFYDATNYNNPPEFTIYSVAPTLSSFTPSTAHAGVDEILTIYGNNFGTQKGEVLFTKDGIAQGTENYLKKLFELLCTEYYSGITYNSTLLTAVAV